ncbi:MAG TPA: matrixin family metalloprotease [Labilithrix sp.]|nr:matrixin family metalloprotease [Labilithrix sp.]
MARAGWMLTAVAATLVAGCYDSQWGQQKAAQQRNAAIAAPAALRTEERVPAGEGEAGPASAPARAQKLRVRAFVTRSFTAQVIDAPRHLRDLLEDANRITERDLGVHLELVETRAWELVNEDDIDKAFEALRAKDAGDGVDWVAGFVGSLPRATRSFHELGKGTLVGQHVVVRAPSSAERHDGIERSFDELPEEQRRDLEKKLRRHRAAAVFLHELGHTLGSVHETSPQSIMFGEYNPKMSAFGPSADDVMRAAVAKHGAADVDLAKDVVAALERAPAGAFVGAERDQLVARLQAKIAAASAPARATPSALPAAVVVPETPELAAADRERFADAFRASARGDVVVAWATGKPLFGAYPRSMGVQDLRCQVASRSMPFDVARKECVQLMKLSTEVAAP